MKVFQKTESDCQRCSYAYVLNLTYDEVPDFVDKLPAFNFKEEDGDIFDKRIDNFLKSIGYLRLIVDCKYDKEKEMLTIPYCSKDEILQIGVLKKEGRKYSHAVVLKVEKNNVSIIFDPKKNSDYDITDITHIEYLFKI